MKTLVLDIGGIFFYPAWRLEGVERASGLLGVSKEAFKKALDDNKRPFYIGKVSEKNY